MVKKNRMAFFDADALRTPKIIKMHHERPKYPKTLRNDQNAPKTTTIPSETCKMTKIPQNPQK